jgi:hypothetical protein
MSNLTTTTTTTTTKGNPKRDAFLVDPNAEKVQLIVPNLSAKLQKEILKALNELEKETSKFNARLTQVGKESVLSYSKRCKILDSIKEKTKLKYEQLSELTNISVSYLKTFAQLSKAINTADGLSIDEFILLNDARVGQQKDPNYSIHALISYLKGNDIFADKGLQTISDKDEAKEQTKANKTQTKVQTKAQTSEPKADANRQTFVFNPLLFGFESKDDITLNITHSPKNTAKPYLVVSNVSSAVLRSMFEKVLRELSKCEKDAEQIAKFEIESETELADNVTLDTFESEFIQVRR